MKILIYSDPHIGLNRLANTTHASAERLREASLNHLHYLLTTVKQKDMLAFCLGDLFDQYSNTEAFIKQAMELIQHTDIVLAGNHDISNRADRVSSLELLHKMYGDRILIGRWGEASTFQLEVGNTFFVFVPHVADQSLFETALLEAQAIAKNSNKWNVLCLHCNYNLNFEALQDTSLNLTAPATDILLGVFHRIFMGHEHNPTKRHNGRVVTIGNVHPTGFDDISDKRVIIYDTETGEYESKHTLSKTALLWEGPLSRLPEEPEEKFLDIDDDLPRGQGFKTASKLYKASEVFAIRLRRKEAEEIKTVATIENMETLPKIVGEDLKQNRPELVNLWEELLIEATGEIQ